jgi:hypothetical protein
MRKFMMLALLGLLALVVSEIDTAACGRQGWRCRRQRPSSVIWEPCSFVVPSSRAQIVSTKSFRSPGGLFYHIHQTSHQDAHEEGQVKTAAEAFTTTSEDDFLGTDRKKAKTSIVDADPEGYASIEGLLGVLLPDKTMLGMGISKAADSDRVKAERHNVTVAAFIYAASKEKDNDYHVILGGPDATRTGRFMNAEISGLPKGTSREQLAIPRQAFKDYFGENVPGRSYAIYDPPISVKVTGSLFFDVDHLAGVVGPGDYKPQTAWEIHPISSITFEP